MADHKYEDSFYDHIELGARRSAREIIRILLNLLPIKSVLDIGCGRGAWLSEWRAAGLDNAMGIDGAYVHIDRLLIPRESFIPHDLTQPLRLPGSFDLVQSLEVAEHLDEPFANGFVDMLVSHGSYVMFSAATPGPGGEFHINEQPLEYWREKFRKRGYRTFDPLRPVIRNERFVEPWYRYNTLLYVKEEACSGLPLEIAKREIGQSTAIPDIRPASCRLRQNLRRILPTSLDTRWTMLKHQVRAHLNPKVRS